MSAAFGDAAVEDFFLGAAALDELYLGTDLLFSRKGSLEGLVGAPTHLLSQSARNAEIPLPAGVRAGDRVYVYWTGGATNEDVSTTDITHIGGTNFGGTLRTSFGFADVTAAMVSRGTISFTSPSASTRTRRFTAVAVRGFRHAEFQARSAQALSTEHALQATGAFDFALPVVVSNNPITLAVNPGTLAFFVNDGSTQDEGLSLQSPYKAVARVETGATHTFTVASRNTSAATHSIVVLYMRAA